MLAVFHSTGTTHSHNVGVGIQHNLILEKIGGPELYFDNEEIALHIQLAHLCCEFN